MNFFIIFWHLFSLLCLRKTVAEVKKFGLVFCALLEVEVVFFPSNKDPKSKEHCCQGAFLVHNKACFFETSKLKATSLVKQQKYRGAE